MRFLILMLLFIVSSFARIHEGRDTVKTETIILTNVEELYPYGDTLLYVKDDTVRYVHKDSLFNLYAESKIIATDYDGLPDTTEIIHDTFNKITKFPGPVELYGDEYYVNMIVSDSSNRIFVLSAGGYSNRDSGATIKLHGVNDGGDGNIELIPGGIDGAVYVQGGTFLLMRSDTGFHADSVALWAQYGTMGLADGRWGTRIRSTYSGALPDSETCLRTENGSGTGWYMHGDTLEPMGKLVLDTVILSTVIPQDSTYTYPSNPQCASYGYLIKTDLHVDTALYFMLKMDYVYSSEHLILDVFLDPQGPSSGVFPTAHAIATGYYGTGSGAADQIDSVFAYDSLGVVWIWIDINNKGGTATFTTKSGRKRVVIDSVYDAVLGDGENGGPERIELRQGAVVNQSQQYHTFYASADSSGLIEPNSYEYISGTQTINGASGSNNFSWSDTNSMGIAVDDGDGGSEETVRIDDTIAFFGIDSLYLYGNMRVAGSAYFDKSATFTGYIYSQYIDNAYNIDTWRGFFDWYAFIGNISYSQNYVKIDTSEIIMESNNDTLFRVNDNELYYSNDNGNAIVKLKCPAVNNSYFMYGSPVDEVGADILWSADDALFYLNTDTSSGEIIFRTGKQVEAMRIDSNQIIKIVNGIQFDNEALLSKYDTVSFAESLFDGITFRAVVTAKYTIIGNVVTVKVPSVTGTITAATATSLRTSPVEIWPSETTYKPVAITNNGSTEIGLILINTNGRNYLYLSDGSQFDAGIGGTITGSSITFQYMLN